MAKPIPEVSKPRRELCLPKKNQKIYENFEQLEKKRVPNPSVHNCRSVGAHTDIQKMAFRLCHYKNYATGEREALLANEVRESSLHLSEGGLRSKSECL